MSGAERVSPVLARSQVPIENVLSLHDVREVYTVPEMLEKQARRRRRRRRERTQQAAHQRRRAHASARSDARAFARRDFVCVFPLPRLRQNVVQVLTDKLKMYLPNGMPKMDLWRSAVELRRPARLPTARDAGRRASERCVPLREGTARARGRPSRTAALVRPRSAARS